MTGTQGAQPEKQIVLPEGEYADYLAQRAGKIADESASKRELAYRTLFGAVLGVLAFLGYSSLSTLETNVETRVSSSLDQKLRGDLRQAFQDNRPEMVREATALLRDEVDAKLALIQFSLIARDLSDDGRTGFSPTERDAAISLLKRATVSEDVKNSEELRAALEKVVDAFYQADLAADIDLLDEALEEVAIDTRGIVMTLTSHYGIRVSGDAELSPPLISRFKKYAKASHRFQLPEIALPYQIALAFREASFRRNDISTKYFNDAATLADAERQQFVRILRGHSFAGITPDADAKLNRVGELFSILMSEYSGELEEIEQSVSSSTSDGQSSEDWIDLLSGLADEQAEMEKSSDDTQ